MNLSLKDKDVQSEFERAVRTLVAEVFNSSKKYTQLQEFVDSAIIEDNFPEDLSEKFLNDMFELQTRLELIAEHQSVNMGLDSMYSNQAIIEQLREQFGHLCE